MDDKNLIESVTMLQTKLLCLFVSHMVCHNPKALDDIAQYLMDKNDSALLIMLDHCLEIVGEVCLKTAEPAGEA